MGTQAANARSGRSEPDARARPLPSGRRKGPGERPGVRPATSAPTFLLSEKAKEKKSFSQNHRSPRPALHGASATGDLPASGESYLVDPASSHMLVSKIKPCMCKYRLYNGETANGSLDQLWFLRSYNPTWITVAILELIHADNVRPSREDCFY